MFLEYAASVAKWCFAEKDLLSPNRENRLPTSIITSEKKRTDVSENEDDVFLEVLPLT